MLTAGPFRIVIISFCAIGAMTMASAQSPSQRVTVRPDARVSFTDLKDHASVPSKFTIKFGASNVEIVPAGEVKANSGHHHLIIDSPLPPLDQPIPNDANHLHFGRGQTEAEIILSPGEHTLQLLLGDHNHIPQNPPVYSDVIHVTVDLSTVQRARTPAPGGASVSFVGLDDGATISTRSTIKFAIAGMTLAPAGTDAPNSGHHHLIIDAPAPDLDREIPNDANHLHFGRGQTETELTLTPGPHTLQLMLADFEHVPHDPPVISKLLHVTVVDTSPVTAPVATPAGRTAAPSDGVVYFVYPSNGAVIYPHSTIRFGLRNMGVAPAGVVKENTGHHHLLIDAPTPPLDQPIPNDPSHMHFGAGQTEQRITLKPGKHTLQLILGDAQHIPFDPPVMSDRIEVTVAIPRVKRRRR